MVKNNKIMFACMDHIIGGQLWLQYNEFDKNFDIELHVQVLILG